MIAIYQKGAYVLHDNHGHEHGRLVNQGAFSCKAQIQTNEEQLDFVKDGLFSAIKITRNGREIGEVKSDWDSLLFKLDLGSRIYQYRLCRKNFWKSTFKIINEYKEELIQIQPQFKWFRLNHDYKIEVVKTSHANEASLVLLAVYGVRKLLERQYVAS